MRETSCKRTGGKGMIEFVWTSLLTGGLILAWLVAYEFLVNREVETVVEVKMWCGNCKRHQWIDEEVVKEWVEDTRLTSRVRSLECSRCGHTSMIPAAPWGYHVGI